MTAETAVLPSRPPHTGLLPDPGTYRAAPGRCVLEVSAALGPLGTLRERLAVRENRVVVESPEEDSSLFVAADRRKGAISFRSTGFAAAESGGLTIPGELAVDEEAVPLALRTRIVRRENDRLLLIGTADFAFGRVRELFSSRLARIAPLGGLRLLLAADFR